MELGCESWGCPLAYCCCVQTFVGMCPWQTRAPWALVRVLCFFLEDKQTPCPERQSGGGTNSELLN